MIAINKDLLVRVLGLASLAINQRSADDYLKSFLLTTKKDRLEVRANNMLSEAIVTAVIEGIEEGQSFCIDSFSLQIIKTMPEGELTLKTDKAGKKLVVSSGRSKHSFALLDIDNFPKEINKPTDYVEYSPDEILTAFKFCSISSSNLSAREILRTYDINPHLNRILTGDGDQISRYTLDLSGTMCNPEVAHIDPLLSLISSLKENDTLKISFANWQSYYLEWVSDKISLVYKVGSITGEFPKVAEETIDALLEKDRKLKLSVQTTKLKAIIDTCQIYMDRAMSEGKAHQTILKYSEGRAEISMNIPDFSEMERGLETEKAEGEDFEIWFDSKDLNEALGVFGKSITLHFYDQNSPFVITDNENDKMVYLQVEMTKEG